MYTVEERRAAHREAQRRWRDAHPEAAAATERKYRTEKKEQSREAWRRYREANAELLSEARREWHEANRERARETQRAWYEAHPDYAVQAERRRRARKIGAEGSFTEEEWRNLCAEAGDACTYCGATGELHADHIVPLSRGGTDWITNITPACPTCNGKKGTLSVEEFVRRLNG